MIETLEIKNFKSVKHLKLDCKRINVLIGEPNTGKSNILEALGVFSFGYHYRYGQLGEFVRFETTSNLFYDDDLDQMVEVSPGDKSLSIRFERGRFHARWTRGTALLAEADGDHRGLTAGPGSVIDQRELPPFKFYRFAIHTSFERPESDFLLPPSGANLLSLIRTHKDLWSTFVRLFSPYGLELSLRRQENKIEVLKRLEGITISYPYSLTSDTLQRLAFFLTAILSNKDSVLVFEEPEAHAFPYHTRFLAETIALDDRGNQFFMSTHNPYFLLPILEKAPQGEVAVFVTYFKDYETKCKVLSEKELEEIAELDVFLNLDRFVEDG